MNDTSSQTSLEHEPMTSLQIGAVLICMVLNLIDGFDVLAVGASWG